MQQGNLEQWSVYLVAATEPWCNQLSGLPRAGAALAARINSANCGMKACRTNTLYSAAAAAGVYAFLTTVGVLLKLALVISKCGTQGQISCQAWVRYVSPELYLQESPPRCDLLWEGIAV